MAVAMMYDVMRHHHILSACIETGQRIEATAVFCGYFAPDRCNCGLWAFSGLTRASVGVLDSGWVAPLQFLELTIARARMLRPVLIADLLPSRIQRAGNVLLV